MLIDLKQERERREREQRKLLPARLARAADCAGSSRVDGVGNRAAASRTGRLGRMMSNLGRGLINTQPQPDRRELDKGKVIRCEFVVPGRDPTTMLDLIEEPFDEIAGSIEMWTEADRIVAITFRRDIGPRAPLDGEFSDPIGIVATVGQQH